MTQDELETFVADNLYGETPDSVVAKLMKDASTFDFQRFVEEDGPLMEQYSEGWSEFAKSGKPVSTQIREAFGSSDTKNPFRRPENYVDEIYETKFKGKISREQYDKELSNLADYWDDATEARRHEAGKYRRKKEIEDDWGILRNAIASEYEKARYINEPEKALFGKEAPELGKAPEYRFAAAADLGLGAAGAAGDMLPGAKMVVGPTIRLGRDIGHYVLDDTYHKTSGEIINDALADFGTTGGIAFLPNFMRQKRMLKNGGADIGAIYDIEKEGEEMVKSARKMQYAMYSPDIPAAQRDRFIRETFNSLPESDFKASIAADVMKIHPDMSEISKKAARAATEGHMGQTAANREVLRNAKQIVHDGVVQTDYTPYARKILSTPELTPFQNKIKPLYGATRTALSSNVGGGIARLGKTVSGVGRTNVKVNDTDWYLQNYTRDWDAGFKPGKSDQKQGNPMWDAYRIWYFNKFGEYPQED
ncbi:MAG: hypothetical protein IKS71_00625 [Bacteroidales bacterium]|nr:hypothetical protein [Bacteroidales bacterium]